MLGISGGYFETIRLPVVRGRAFSDADGTPGHESAIVNQGLATMHFPGEDPIGRRIRLVDATPRLFDPSMAAMTATIIGLVPSVRQRKFREPDPDPVVYVPYQADAQRFMTLLVRAPGDPASITSLVREEMRALELLVQTGTRDPVTLVSIAALLILVSLAACFWPARRATRLDPVSACGTTNRSPSAKGRLAVLEVLSMTTLNPLGRLL